jgi:hypothetical protein
MTARGECLLRRDLARRRAVERGDVGVVAFGETRRIGTVLLDVDAAFGAVEREPRADGAREGEARVRVRHVARSPQSLAFGHVEDAARERRASLGRRRRRRFDIGACGRGRGRIRAHEPGEIGIARRETCERAGALDRGRERFVVHAVGRGDALSSVDDRAHAYVDVGLRDVLVDRVLREAR